MLGIQGRMAARIPADWGQSYAHPIYVLETFNALSTLAPVDPTRFRGTCYRAANWMVLALPLHRRFRELWSA